MLGPKHQGGPYGEGRAFSIVGGELPSAADRVGQEQAGDRPLAHAARRTCRSRRPAVGAGQHRQAYLKIDFLYSEYLDMWHHTHLMDAMAGTHLVPPAFALPPEGDSRRTRPRSAAG